MINITCEIDIPHDMISSVFLFREGLTPNPSFPVSSSNHSKPKNAKTESPGAARHPIKSAYRFFVFRLTRYHGHLNQAACLLSDTVSRFLEEIDCCRQMKNSLDKSQSFSVARAFHFDGLELCIQIVTSEI